MTGTALVTYDAKRAAAAQAYVEQTYAPPSGDMLSIKGGLFSLNDEAIGDHGGGEDGVARQALRVHPPPATRGSRRHQHGAVVDRKG